MAVSPFYTKLLNQNWIQLFNTLPPGGVAGQVLTKDSTTDFDVSWTTPAASGVSSVSGAAPIASSGGANPIISLNNTAVTPGSYTNANITVDQKGRITAASNGSSSATVWGTITGTLSAQTDLQTALNAKQNLITTGTTAQYFRGDLSLATFPTDLSVADAYSVSPCA